MPGTYFNSLFDNFSVTEFAPQNQPIILGLTKLKDGSKKMNISTGFDSPEKSA